jgi:cyclopropane-fatty-acyl-phospholipid synthase
MEDASSRRVAHAPTLPPAPDGEPPRDETQTDEALTHARAAVAALFGAPRERSFDIRYWDGSVEHASAVDAAFTLCVNRRGALRRMLLPPSELSIVEAYLSDDVDIDGSLEGAVSLSDAISARIRSPRALARLLRHLLALPSHEPAPTVRDASAKHVVPRAGRPHDPSRDKAAIQYHYDVGNDFYSLWLDRRMVYSCAYFRTPEDSLDQAQLAKLDLVCRKLRLRPGERLLDVGCGWGALIMHATRHYGVTALGITLSEAQAEYARARIREAGLEDRCRVEVLDYRALPAELQFDKIASIGMVEHVGEERLRDYFSSLYRALAPGGLFLNHGIVSEAAARPRGRMERLERTLWRRDAFIDQYVFPDGDLVPFRSVITSGESAGFETRDVESLREHYALTLRHWVARLTRERDRAVAIAGERVFRTWHLYMAASARAFATASINVLQTLFAKPDAQGDAHLPLTREDIFAPDPHAPPG